MRPSSFVKKNRKIHTPPILKKLRNLHKDKPAKTKIMDKEERIEINSVKAYNDFSGVPTLHPQVAVIDMAQSSKEPPIRFSLSYGVYALFLKQTYCGDMIYGKQTYDYQEGTIVSFAPGQVVKIDRSNNLHAAKTSKALLFDAELIKGTTLGKNIKKYTFFSYQSNEALHLSEEEKEIINDCLKKIDREIHNPEDHHSRHLIISNIELLLDYCMRFYDRQFETRTEVNKGAISKFEEELNDYFEKGKTQQQGLPTVKYFAEQVCLSPNYFGDMVKKETGRTPQDYIQDKVLDIAKEEIRGTDKTIKEIAYDLGFQYSQHFNQFFKRNVGQTPTEYRRVGAA